MSHYTALVALPGTVQRSALDDAIGQAMAPYDENIQVEAYRKYEDGAAEDHWFVRAMRRSAEHVHDGTGILPYKPNDLGWSSDSSKKTPTEQQADLIRDAQVAEALGDHPTWPQVLAAYAERYPGEETELLYDPETESFGEPDFEGDPEATFPDMSARKAVVWSGQRSGLLVLRMADPAQSTEDGAQ